MALYNGSDKVSSQINLAQYTDTTELMKYMTAEVGDIGQVMLPLNENENKRRYLNGQIILQDQFTTFTSKLKQAVKLYPSIACTETEWQAYKKADLDGQCAKFVIDDTAKTIRLPRVMHMVGTLNLYKMAEGIPNRRLVRYQKSSTSGYMLYSDGWCEQWGRTGSSTSTAVKFTITMADANYAVHITVLNSNGDQNWSAQSLSTTGFNVVDTESLAHCWRVEGWAPIPTTITNTVSSHTVDYESPYYIQVSTGVDYEVDVTNTFKVNNPYSYGMTQRSNNKLSNAGWILSDNLWKDGTYYTGLYNWILTEYNKGTSSDISIVLADSATDTADPLYNYKLDTANQKFKLPTLLGDEQVQDKDTYISLNDQFFLVSGTSYTYTAPYNGYFYAHARTNGTSQYIGCYSDTVYNRMEIWYNASGGMVNLGPIFLEKGQTLTDIRSNFVNASDRIVRFFKAKSGYKYLYFYAGNVEQNVDLINVGHIVENIANIDELAQMGRSLSDLTAKLTLRYVTAKWNSGTNGYTIYNDGYCEQWGRVYGTDDGTTTVTFHKTFADTNYFVSLSDIMGQQGSGYFSFVTATDYNTTYMNVAYQSNAGSSWNACWKACGYLAEGQY